MSDEVLDVAVIGGGIAGVYTAWRLLTKGKEKKIAVFEASDHIGGRLLSAKPPFISNMKAELGGMRILLNLQPKITALVKTLDVKTYPFPVDQPNNIAYLRGTHLRLSDFTARPAKVPYHLTFQEFGQTAGGLVVNAIEQVVPGIANVALTDDERRAMCQAATFAGAPLYQQGFWQVLMRVMSEEAYQLAMAAGGYDSTLSNWNAADAIPWFLSDFGLTPTYLGFTNGYQEVPERVADLVKAAHGRIELNRALKGFETTDGGVQLEFHTGEPVRARHVVLAMPRRSLELLAPHSPLLREPAVSQLIRSVTGRSLFKVFTTYNEPWWLPANVKAGRTVTDLPVRQTYYWPQSNGDPAESGRAMLMASYDDGLNTGFWDGFRPKHGLHWPGRENLAPATPRQWFESKQADLDPDSKEWYKNKAPTAMVEELQRELGAIHGLKYVPRVVDASFKDWGDDPFGGGWNSWNIGVRSPVVKEQILKPVKDVPVYICGEAYSDAQGWVEGSLQTADMMLERYFGIAPMAEKPVAKGKGA